MKSSTPEPSQEIKGPVLGEKIQSPVPSTGSTAPPSPQWKPVTNPASGHSGIQVDQNGKLRTNIP